jgi:DNA-nicking Smr family endonuclease
MEGRRGKRHLSETERGLWDKVAQSVAPLKPRRIRKKAAALAAAAAAASEPAAPPMAPPEVAPAHPPVPHHPPSAPKRPKKPMPAIPPLAPVERRLIQKMVRGIEPPAERIDLHGMTQHDALPALRGFLSIAQARGAKVVIVITGKGKRHAPGTADWLDPTERGVLRRVVPHWLSSPEFRPLVIGFEEAHVAHGGSGALYVRVRRPKGAA